MNSNEIAHYLNEHPHFFEEHAELLATIKLTSPILGKSISLQERQMEVVRDKIRGLELRLAELNRHAKENEDIAAKYKTWSRELLLARNDVDLPHILAQGLKDIFNLPYASLRMWNVASDYTHTWFAQTASDDVHLFAKGLQQAYCGKNQDFEAAAWLEADQEVLSVAMMPLRLDADSPCFGLLILGSNEISRFTKDMSTDFLAHIASSSSAALHCLTDTI